MTDIAQLNQGRFYWVLVRSSTKDPQWQPARFTHIVSHGTGASWDFIGFHGDIGHHFIEVVDIGPEIIDDHASPDPIPMLATEPALLRPEHGAESRTSPESPADRPTATKRRIDDACCRAD